MTRLDHRSRFYKNSRTLAEECGEILYYHQALPNQILHLITSAFTFCGIFTIIALLSNSFLASFGLMLAFLAYYFFLDAYIVIFWFPIMSIALWLSQDISSYLLSHYSLIVGLGIATFVTLVNMLLQLLGHFVFETIKPVLGHVDLFEFLVMTPFTIAYYGLQWISGGVLRKDEIDAMRKAFAESESLPK